MFWKEKKSVEEINEQDGNGGFVGFVLLSEASWDKKKIIRDLEADWNIKVDSDNKDDNEEVLIFNYGDMIVSLALMSGCIPDNEAEINAANNYMWPEAVEAIQTHKAYILVAVLGSETSPIERGKIFTKIISSCCKQEPAIGVYTSGTVFEPEFYIGFADMMKDDELPIFNWIWFGMYKESEKICCYTYGMKAFGKDEMEVLDGEGNPSEVRDFLASLVEYVINGDVILKSGETIGFSEDDKHKITRGEGVSLPETMLKISYVG